MTLIVSEEELDAIKESVGTTASLSAYSLILKSGRSGPFSCTKSAFDSAAFISVVKLKRSRDAPGERPMLVSTFQASSTYLRRFASASGAGSVATTSNPRARYCADQLAPITPVPTTAMRRTALFKAMICAPVVEDSKCFGVGNARKISLDHCDGALLRSIEMCRVDRARQICREHPIAPHIK